MWLGMNAPTGFISNVFGVPTTPQVDTDKTALPNLENPMSMRVRRLIDDVREKRHRSMRVKFLHLLLTVDKSFERKRSHIFIILT